MKKTATDTFLKLHKIIEQGQPVNDTLLGGRLGLALYYHALYEAFDKTSHAEKALFLLDQVFTNLEKKGPQLFGNAFGGGGAGLGWVVTRFHQSGLLESNLRDDLAVLDDHLYQASMEQILYQDKIDYLHGATGTIHYFTQRLPDKKIEQYLINLITALCNKAVKEEYGIWLKNRLVERKGDTEINLSLSHGLCSFLIILIHAFQKGLNLPCIIETVTRGIDFILHYQQDIDIAKKNWSFFPSTVSAMDLSEFFVSKRLAWCYGDFGPVLLLYKAGNIIDNRQWTEKANLFGTFSMMRKEVEETVTSESLFCHGTAGMAQCYKTFHELSGIERYKKGQEYWIRQTIDLIPSEMEKALYHGKECDLLEGLVGVNLSLLSFISDRPLSWSKAFLL